VDGVVSVCCGGSRGVGAWATLFLRLDAVDFDLGTTFPLGDLGVWGEAACVGVAALTGVDTVGGVGVEIPTVGVGTGGPGWAGT
jgi:hypothetical protein